MSLTQGLPVTEPIDDAAAHNDAIALFLRTQASWLAHGLARADDPTAVGIVLGRHDVSHERWLGVIAYLDRVDQTVAEQLATLYAFHGRIVGCLERGPDPRLGADVHQEVRRMLSRRLAAMTSECVTAVAAPLTAVLEDVASA
jgi:hypothetical protein